MSEKCHLFYIHILYFCAVQGGLGDFNVDLNLILELLVGHGRRLCLCYLVGQDSAYLLCVSHATCVHGFISSGILCFH